MAARTTTTAAASVLRPPTRAFVLAVAAVLAASLLLVTWQSSPLRTTVARISIDGSAGPSFAAGDGSSISSSRGAGGGLPQPNTTSGVGVGHNSHMLLARTDLFLPITARFVQEFEDHLLTSMRLFYPQAAGTLQLVLDGEKPGDHAAAKQLSAQLSGLGLKHQVHFAEPDSRVYGGSGHTRQQLVMFWADNFTSAEFVGFVDTDTTFVTRVVDSDVFGDGGKPRIIAQVGRPQNSWWQAVPPSTSIALGREEVMRCMSYFPVVVRVAHLQQLRRHVEQLHSQQFDSVFARFSARHFSQFNIMCNYLWHHHRDEYVWSLQEMSPGWSGSVPGQVPASVLADLLSDSSLTHPAARTTVHAGYLHFPDEPPHLAKAMLHGFCLSGGTTARPALCSQLPNSTELQRDMFVFETNDWTWDPRCMDAQRTHYSNVQRAAPQPWNLTLVDLLAAEAAAVMQ